MIREPVVAGKFYPDDPEILKSTIKNKIGEDKTKLDCKGIIVPHAGYLYSGPVAGEVYSQVRIPDNILIIGPNHQGIGNFFSLSGVSAWKTPFGEIKVNEELNELIIKYSPFIKIDNSAHQNEHSIEVQLPFIQYFKQDIKISALAVIGYELGNFLVLGKSIANAINDFEEEVLIIVSSDFSHYVPHDKARKLDHMAIDKILKVDPEGLWETVKKNKISICGVASIIIMLEAIKTLGDVKGKLIRYSTSGEAVGDYSSVVGYAGIILQ